MLRVIRHNSTHAIVYPPLGLTGRPSLTSIPSSSNGTLPRPLVVILVEVGATLRAFLEATKASFKPRDNHNPFDGIPSGIPAVMAHIAYYYYCM
jgi:hypothetical protein